MIGLAITIWQAILGGTAGAGLGGDSGGGAAHPTYFILGF